MPTPRLPNGLHQPRPERLPRAALSGIPVGSAWSGGCCARWTPDSQYIVFRGLSASGNVDLIARSRDGGYRQELLDGVEQDWYCAVSPDGSQVAYSKQLSEFAPSSLWLMDLQIGEPTMVKEVSWGRVKAAYR